MTINEIQDEIIEEFEGLTDWMDRYAYIIDLGNTLPDYPEALKTPENLIEGCQSRVWIDAKEEADGELKFEADSDALIVKGIVALLLRVLSGHTPQEILDADLYFIDKIGLKEHLSPTRSNGLVSMVKQIHNYALAYKAKQDTQKG
ncbi:MAG: SufE family protein [Muribaculaceae bacterium]|nr:SufE family protein [Muribaculaceae bacterium]